MVSKIFRTAIFLLLFLFPVLAQSQAQLLPDQYRGKKLTLADSVGLAALPELRLTDAAKRIELPPVVDNSGVKYLRPVFNQVSSSCGQAAGVVYNFTYEIDRARDLSADTSINQYPSHFTFNFQNDGYGNYGVSYLHSFEILKKIGCPTIEEYGGMALPEGNEWVSGYDLYYHAMHNRIRGVKQAPVGTPQGLQVLKHWLNDHADGSDVGGVANFYSSSPWNYKFLPNGTPEAGKIVMTQFSGTVATHAMTIVGYNDSIRYDYNGDGLYTNNIDINDDGIVDMKDWEIGGVKCVNSYGPDWGDSGFFYMMYKLFAEELYDGGIWNHVVHVLDVNEEYTPELTMKLTLEHNSREKIRITAGVSVDTSAARPEHVISYPAFNYQGGDQYMQGGRTDPENKMIEIGLDITPLLGYVEPGQQAEYFVEVSEADPDNEGTGQIISYSLMDYHAGGQELHCPQENVPLKDNATTRLAVVHAVSFDKVQVTNTELPAAVGGQPYQQQMNAQGGTPPYTWDMLPVYHQQSYDSDFPVIDEKQLTTELPYDRWAIQSLGFDFPFYDTTYNMVYMHRDGFLMFDQNLYPWPYYHVPELLFSKTPMVAAFLFGTVKFYGVKEPTQELWYEGDATHAAFRWKQTLMWAGHEIGEGEFAVILYPDGNIEYYYNNIQVNENIRWYAGVSAGDEKTMTRIGTSGTTLLPAHPAFSLTPEVPPANLKLSADGMLSGTPQVDDRIYNLRIRATDDHGVTAAHDFQFSDGLIFSYDVNGGDDAVVQSGEEVSINLTVKNIYQETFHNVSATLENSDPYIQLNNAQAAIGDLLPGQEVTLTGAFAMTVDDQCPDRYDMLNGLLLACDEADWNGRISFEVLAPELSMYRVLVEDDNNQRLDPGETADVAVEILNNGYAGAGNLAATLTSSDPYISIGSATGQPEVIPAGGGVMLHFPVTAAENTPIAHIASFGLNIEYNQSMALDENFDLTIGQFPVLIYNKAQNTLSRDSITAALDELGVVYNVVDSLPANLGLYRSVFVCLGTFYTNGTLTDAEGVKLTNYLLHGGKMYMEGSLTWHLQPQTLVHPYFGVDIETLSWPEFEQLRGLPGTFTENMIFDFTGEYNVLPCYMIPKPMAYAILAIDTSTVYNTAVASTRFGIKTVGSVFEFGSMGTQEQRVAYMTKLLEFFDLGDYIVGTAPEYAGQPALEVHAGPNPFAGRVTIEVLTDAPDDVSLDIFDLSGQQVQHFSGHQNGTVRFTWGGTDSDGRLLPPGIYIYQVRCGNRRTTGKLVRLH